MKMWWGLRAMIKHRGALGLGCLGALALIVAGCGNSVGTTSAAANGVSHSAGISNSSSFSAAATPNQAQVGSKSPNGTQQPAATAQYLIKSLQAGLAVTDPRQTANDLRQWILSTDPRAQTAGIDYERQGDGTYNVQMTFSVQATLYPQVENYLANYAQGHGGRLLRLHEDTQDVTNQYVDSQSRLSNLRVEQQRLLDLLARSTDLTQTLAIDQRLTDVEGQIEQIEGQLNQLGAQTTFYNVTIDLSPIGAATSGPKPGPWNIADVFQAALNAALALGQFLAAVGVWLGVFAIYIVPVLLVIWLVRRWLRTRKPAAI